MWSSENVYGKLSKSQIIGSKTENCKAGKNIRKVLVNIYEWALKKWKKWMWTPIFPVKNGKQHIKRFNGHF